MSVWMAIDRKGRSYQYCKVSQQDGFRYSPLPLCPPFRTGIKTTEHMSHQCAENSDSMKEERVRSSPSINLLLDIMNWWYEDHASPVSSPRTVVPTVCVVRVCGSSTPTTTYETDPHSRGSLRPLITAPTKKDDEAWGRFRRGSEKNLRHAYRSSWWETRFRKLGLFQSEHHPTIVRYHCRNFIASCEFISAVN